MLAQELYRRVTPLLHHDDDRSSALTSIVKEYVPEALGIFELDSCPTPLALDTPFESGWFMIFPDGGAFVYIEHPDDGRFSLGVLGPEQPEHIPNFFYAMMGHSTEFKDSVLGPSILEA